MRYRNDPSTIELKTNWQFAYSSDPKHSDIQSHEDLKSSGLATYGCTVPGNFELDLQANDIIDEPFYGMNIASLTPYEKCHIWYYTTFQAEDIDGYDTQLTFEGLDCCADIFLNNRRIGSTDNMLIEHTFIVNGLLKGENELVVRIRPAVEEAKKFDYPPSLRAMFQESLYLRKAPHMFGWDIMPRAVSAGIWRPVKLQYLPKEHLEQVYLETQHLSPNHASAGLCLHFRANLSGDPQDIYEIALEGTCEGSSFSARSRVLFDSGKLFMNVDAPKLWCPRGRGDANLYKVTVTLLKNGSPIDRMDFSHGIRTVELVRTGCTDADGSGEFCFVVNGEKVFVLGSNWVPADAYHSRDVERIPRMLELVEEIGCNMLRCWGGNVYENDIFFDTCDQKGVMVWQDFAMACATYPQDDEFAKRLETEARKVVRRLRQHPSIVLWSGDNECDWGYTNIRRDPNSNRLTRKVLPQVITEEDPLRPYLPSSPFISPEAYATGKPLSEDHLWGPRDYYKGDYYRNALCHFASEIGYHGCPSPDSMRKFISPEKLWPYQNNEQWILHSTSPIPGVDMYDYRVELMTKQIRVLFGEVPDNLEDFSFASQVSQAEAKKFFIEMFRNVKWRRTGIIWWNIIDGWPQLSDAVVDYYFSRKLAYDYIKRSQNPVCLMLKEPVDGEQELVASNDTRTDAEMTYRVRDIDMGETLAEGAGTATSDSATILCKIPCPEGKQRFLMIEWTGQDCSGYNHYLAGDPPFDLETYKRWWSFLNR